MTKIDGGICAAKGFKASGTYCGIKKPAVENPNPDYVHKNDICLVACDVLCNTAAVYTQNKVKGAPILVTKDHHCQLQKCQHLQRRRRRKSSQNVPAGGRRNGSAC